MTNEEKAHKFLDYIAQNEKELKRILRKNITYDENIFEDSFQDSIIKCYNTIVKNGTDISDYKKYFFLASKFTYVLSDNRNKRKINVEEREYFSNDKNDIAENDFDAEDRFKRVMEITSEIKAILSKRFSEEDINLYFEYYSKKTTDGYSYARMAEDNNTTISDIGERIKNIKNFVMSDPKINGLKKRLTL